MRNHNANKKQSALMALCLKKTYCLFKDFFSMNRKAFCKNRNIRV